MRQAMEEILKINRATCQNPWKAVEKIAAIAADDAERAKIPFTRINNDSNGNLRYVCHFLALMTREEMDRYHAEHGLQAISLAYAAAVKKAHKIGGRKYHNKQYGGGIVFQSYSLQELENDIKGVI